MVKKISFFLFSLSLGFLGTAKIFAVDVQTGIGSAFWGYAMDDIRMDSYEAQNLEDMGYVGFAAFLGLEKRFAFDIMALGLEYEFAYGREIDSEEFLPQWDGPSITQHTPKVYAKLRAGKFLSLAGTMGLDLAILSDAEEGGTEMNVTPTLGMRFQVLAFYGQVDYFYLEEGVITRISLGAMLP